MKALFRSSEREIAFRTMRKAFERFPNIDLEEPVELGRVGFYDGRRCQFEWRTNLKTLGISPKVKKKMGVPPVVDRVYTTGESTCCKFSIEGSGVGAANFSFPRSNNLAAQAPDMTSSAYDIYDLETKIKIAIDKGLIWDKNWVVVTHVYPADAYSILYSRSNKSEATIATAVPVKNEVFNIADPTLNISASYIFGEVMNSLAKKNVTPLFRIHKLKGWGPKSTSEVDVQSVTFEPYG